MEEKQLDYLYIQQIRILLGQSWLTFLFPMIAASALCYILWPVARQNHLAVWTAVVILYSLIRCVITRRLGRRQISAEAAPRLLQHFTLIVFISGALWGVAAIVLIPYKPQSLMDFTLYNSLVLLIICGLVAGAVVSHSVSRQVFIFYALPALVPPALHLITLGDKYNSALGGFVLLYLLFITASSFLLNNQYRHFINLQYRLYRLEQEQAGQGS
jgi:hypothetical protein